jgi:hypothetical protein
MRSAFNACLNDAETLHHRSVSGQLSAGRREPEPAPAGRHWTSRFVPHGVPQQPWLGSRTAPDRRDGRMPPAIVGSKRLPLCTSASGQRPVTDDREIVSA